MKKIVLCLLVLMSVLFVAGCEAKIEPNNNSTKDDKTSMVGYYLAFETVQYGKKYGEKETKSENITLLIRDDNTATLKWGNSEGKDYKIDGDQFIALAGDEKGTITYKNGVVIIKLSDGDYISFKK